MGSSLHPNRNQNPSLFSNESSISFGSPSNEYNPYSPPQQNQPWQNFPTPSASNVNLYAPARDGGREEGRGFLDRGGEDDIGLPAMEAVSFLSADRITWTP